jgi:hypothetical protein
LAEAKCRKLFLEFSDARPLPLAVRLEELDTDPGGYLAMVFFLDGERAVGCGREGVLAFTTPGSRAIYVCGRSFERAWRRDRREAQATIVHELLHSLGLGENPPSPRSISDRVRQLCWQ